MGGCAWRYVSVMTYSVTSTHLRQITASRAPNYHAADLASILKHLSNAPCHVHPPPPPHPFTSSSQTYKPRYSDYIYKCKRAPIYSRNGLFIFVLPSLTHTRTHTGNPAPSFCPPQPWHVSQRGREATFREQKGAVALLWWWAHTRSRPELHCEIQDEREEGTPPHSSARISQNFTFLPSRIVVRCSRASCCVGWRCVTQRCITFAGYRLLPWLFWKHYLCVFKTQSSIIGCGPSVLSSLLDTQCSTAVFKTHLLNGTIHPRLHSISGICSYLFRPHGSLILTQHRLGKAMSKWTCLTKHRTIGAKTK